MSSEESLNKALDEMMFEKLYDSLWMGLQTDVIFIEDEDGSTTVYRKDDEDITEEQSIAISFFEQGWRSGLEAMTELLGGNRDQ